jgi:isopentenyl-diphosphate delta-isomerase
MQPKLKLVDKNDHIIGYEDKLEVHRKGYLHRAFSIFIVNKKGQLMLQKRAVEKYHSGGLWANTCCSHQIKGEDQEVTVHKRLVEEMGFDCELKPIFKFIYRAELDHNFIENELDHVYIGFYEKDPKPNAAEVCDWKWMDIESLKNDLKESPDKYVYWLKEAFSEFYLKYKELTN